MTSKQRLYLKEQIGIITRDWATDALNMDAAAGNFLSVTCQSVQFLCFITHISEKFSRKVTGFHIDLLGKGKTNFLTRCF